MGRMSTGSANSIASIWVSTTRQFAWNERMEHELLGKNQKEADEKGLEKWSGFE
jgi:hypothetical protein